MRHSLLSIIIIIIALSGSNPVKSDTYQQPTAADYLVGEKWVWKYKGATTEGEIRADGTDTREVVSRDNVIGITIGENFVPITEITKPVDSDTPRYKWPLEVGKQWTFEEHWTSQDGTKGKTSLAAEVVSYKKETVDAGTFMAYTVQYKGKITNSRGYSADVEETFVYAPAVKNFIKLIQSQADYIYEEELIEYAKP